MITLEPVDKLIPASYNPRKVIKERLDMVKLSLQKLGWLSPVFATPTGEILSGHQRTFCARELGYTVVPVFVVPHVEENKRKALNMLFNRSTNDMDLDSNPDKLSVELLNQNVLNIAAGLPDHPIDIFPCIQWAKERPIADLVKLNSGRWIRYALNVSKTLWKNGIIGRAIGGILETRSAKLVAIEESEEMVQKYNAPGKVVCRRAQDYRYREFDLAILFLVLMFVPVADRSNLIHKLRQSLKPGGAIIVFDKVVAPPGYFGTVMRRLTMTWKLNNGATPKEIVDKELSLSGVQRPISPTILGHDAVQFFTFGEFAGWVIEKPE